MSGPSEDLEKLLESVADGDAIDWDEFERTAPDEGAVRLIRQLRLIADVGDIHRSYVDQVVPGETEAVTAPGVSPAPAHDGQRRVLPQLGTPPGPGSAAKGSAAKGSAAQGSAAPAANLGVWGHLLLVRKIGEGSYGDVYQAHDTWLDHPVALKLLKREAEKRVQPSELLHEARKLARVRHLNVVTVHGADRHNGRVGFWMDFIDGETLASRVGRGRLSAGEAVSIGQEVCRALAAVHRANIIHRDVKAQNVMRAHDGGRIILMDFGAGQFVEDLSSGRRGQGTPLYLAPEVLRSHDASAQSDIYAVGVLLYHLVTGRFPVEASSPAELAEAHARGQRRRLRDERPDLPDSFIATVERALEPDPARRYASAGEMKATLADETSPIAILRPAGVDPVAAPALTPRQSRLLYWLGSALMTVAALTLAGFITSTGYYVAIGLAGPFLDESVLSWPGWGFRALLPGAVLVTATTLAGVALFIVLYQHILLNLRVTRVRAERLGGAVRALVQRMRESPAATTAPLLFITQCAVLGVACWWFRDLLGGLDSLIAQTPGDLTALSPVHHAGHQQYRMVFSLELYGFAAAWAAVIRAKRARREPGAWVGVLGGIAVTVLTLILLVVPYRILVKNEHQRVSYESQICYLIGERGTEALLFCPLLDPPRNRLVTLGHPALKRDGPIEYMFAQLPGRVYTLKGEKP